VEVQNGWQGSEVRRNSGAHRDKERGGEWRNREVRLNIVIRLKIKNRWEEGRVRRVASIRKSHER